MFGTKLRRSPAQEAAIKWQIEIIGTKLFLRMQTKNWTSLDIKTAKMICQLIVQLMTPTNNRTNWIWMSK